MNCPAYIWFGTWCGALCYGVKYAVLLDTVWCWYVWYSLQYVMVQCVTRYAMWCDYDTVLRGVWCQLLYMTGLYGFA